MSNVFLFATLKAEALRGTSSDSKFACFFFENEVLCLGSFDWFWSIGVQTLPYHSYDYSYWTSLSYIVSLLVNLEVNVFFETTWCRLLVLMLLSLMHPADPTNVIMSVGCLILILLGSLGS